MQIDEVRIGKTYLVKIGSNQVEATITRKHEQGGWEATTVRTGKNHPPSPVRSDFASWAILRPAVKR